MSRSLIVRAFSVALVLVAAVGPANAVQRVDTATRFEISRADLTPYGPPSDAARIERREVERALAGSFTGNWRVFAWNTQTRTPTSFYGSGLQVAASLLDDTSAIAAARALVEQNPGVFRADMHNLRVVSAPGGLGKRSVIYQQTYHGLDVWGGRVHLVFTEEGRFFTGGSEYYPDIDVAARPSISTSVAEDLARANLPFNPSTDRIGEGSRLFVLPIQVSADAVDYHLAWKVTIHTADPVGNWVSFVDAHSGEIIWRFNDIHFVNFTGWASGDVHPDTYCNGTVGQRFRYLRVQVSGVGSTTTNGLGNWTMFYGGIDTRTVVADLYGPYVNVNNVAGTDGVFVGIATPGVPFNVHFTDSNSKADERDVFTAVNDIHDFFQLFDPSFAYTNQRITANVRAAETCNAFWNSGDGSINFNVAGAGCANTGEIQGMVHHEYGHGVQDAILGGQGTEGLGEGNGDILANLLTQESTIGRGLILGNCTSGIRNSENTLRYPDDVIGQEIHNAGRVIAGFNWDMMQALQALEGTAQGTVTAARLWHFGRVLTHPTNQPAQVLAAFIADDDNGNLDDGTPHYDQICEGATNHGFQCPEITLGVFIEHTPIETSTTGGERIVSATITTTSGTLIAAETWVEYRVDGGPFVRLPLVDQGGDLWTTAIPVPSENSELQYYIHAQDSEGREKTSPLDAPAETHAFDFATVWDPQESANGWAVNQEGGDDAAAGNWVRVDPNGTSAQPEDDHTISGTMCWVTGDAPAGSNDGTNDVDSGTTTLYTSLYDLTGATTAKAKYFRWYSNNTNGLGDDTWSVEVRNNGGGWQEIELTTVSNLDWQPVTDDLTTRFGVSLGQVQFKFSASDLGGASIVEAAIDDFEILTELDDTSGVPGPETNSGPRFALQRVTPNPARGDASISFEVPAASSVRLTVHDVTGRTIKSVLVGEVPPGSHSATWDRRDDLGRTVASGIYYYRLSAPGFTATRSFVLMR